MLDVRSLAPTPQARLRAATTPILSIYIFIYLGTRVTLLRTEGGGCSPGALNSTIRSALATLADSSDFERPQPISPSLFPYQPTQGIYLAVRKHVAATLTAAQMSSRSFLGDPFERICSDGTNGIYDIEIVTGYRYSSDLRPIPVGVSSYKMYRKCSQRTFSRRICASSSGVKSF